MSKYYTPEIEEFHVGFEYEYSGKETTVTGEGLEINYSSEVYDDSLISSGISDDLIRVKYLDREDIESLGFADAERPDNFGYAGEYMIIKDAKMRKPSRTEVVDIHLVFQPLTNWILIWQIMDLHVGKQENTRFCGTIKNKSELKRILKQIGV